MNKQGTQRSAKAQRVTRQRKIILEELRKVESHPTANQIYLMVRRRIPRVSLGTVYRNLDILAEKGEIARLKAEGTQGRFDGNNLNHYHVQCVRCGKVDDIDVKPSDAIEEAARKSCDYEITGHRLLFTGLCPDCATRGRRRA